MYRIVLGAGLFFILIAPETATTSVTGVCDNCHTMHNSQGGSTLAHSSSVGSPAGWTGGNQLAGGTSEPQGNLLVSNCVGCHSSSTSATIINLGSGLRIPIVFNTVEPTTPLAGGNFYYTVTNGDNFGHNVRGISAADAVHLANGNSPGQQLGCANSCHVSLALTDDETVPLMDGGHKNGCQGCHQSVRHHGIDPAAGQPVDEESGWYRYLSAPSGHLGFGNGVYGIEDADWEQNPTSAAHNTHYGGDNTILQEEPQSIGRFCAGCHYQFHSPGNAFDLVDNGGGINPWLRHPANATIPNADEYTSYTVYDPMVPVGRPEKDTIASVDPTVVRPGADKVICLSCHRAHGSPYPDMLRWDYANDCRGEVPDPNCGCFTCHSTKDE